MEIIRSVPLHLQCYHSLNNLILEGEFQPGEVLTEVQLSEILGVSRGTIREALRMLIKDGLITGKGVKLKVFSPTPKELKELYQCRAYLESLAAKLAAKIIDDKQLSEIEALIGKAETSTESNLHELTRYNMDFHHSILIASKNTTLIEMMEPIKNKMLFIRKQLFNHEFRNKDYLKEHVEIYHALMSRNSERCESLMKKHILNDLNAYLEIYNGGKEE